jgi:AraC family transcriptional regulator of adaptative response/methylated-DNA-[protein]-cysteine methyltransferase
MSNIHKIIKTDISPKSKRGQGMVIHYNIIPSVYGDIIVGQSEYGLCWVGFTTHDGETKMKSFFPKADFITSDLQIDSNNIHLCGTAMQINVWEALLNVASGKTSTYGDVARTIKKPTAYRAVGSAVGANPLSVIVPCHRILGANGNVNHYGWGTNKKKNLLKSEGVNIK